MSTCPRPIDKHAALGKWVSSTCETDINSIEMVNGTGAVRCSDRS
jgi:hypothetical protein